MISVPNTPLIKKDKDALRPVGLTGRDIRLIKLSSISEAT
jgi:hypothetical protein